ncbi:MAG TPA: HAD family hydrolase [Thermoplasmata archaeon]|nr:HAD family hydrolase [Thermoplasmata archaeon]
MTKNTGLRAALPKAIMFDLDDTLVISTIEFKKFRTRLLSYIRDKVADQSDYSTRETIVTMIDRFEEEMKEKEVNQRTISSYLDDIDAFLNEIELENIEKTVSVPGAKELLRSLKEKNVKIGILTRGSTEYAERALKIAGLDGYVDAMVARDRKAGIMPKPSPESAFALAERLGVPIEDTIMVGDYSIDFVCARDTGIRFFGIASDRESRRNLSEAGCKEILSSLDEFRVRVGL